MHVNSKYSYYELDFESDCIPVRVSQLLKSSKTIDGELKWISEDLETEVYEEKSYLF